MKTMDTMAIVRVCEDDISDDEHADDNNAANDESILSKEI